MYVNPGSSRSSELLFLDICIIQIQIQGGAVCVTPGSSSSSGELLLSLSVGPAASPGSTAGEPTTALWQLVLERKQMPSE